MMQRVCVELRLGMILGLILISISCGCNKEPIEEPVAIQQSTKIPKTVRERQTLHDLADAEIFDELKGFYTFDSLWPVKENEPEFQWPEGTDDSLRDYMEGFLVEPKLTTIHSIPTNKLPTRNSVDMSADGKLLYVIDTDNLVQIIDLDKKTDKLKFASPIEKTYGILADVAGEHVFLLNASTFVKVDLATQKIVLTIENIPATVIELTRALATNDIAAITSDSEIIVVDKNFQGFEVMPNTTTEAQHVAIHPEGKYIAGSDRGHIFRWHLDESPHRLEYLQAEDFTFMYMPVTSDYDADRWFDSFAMHQYEGQEHLGPVTVRNRKLPLIVNLQVIDAVNSSVRKGSWTTMVGRIVDGTAVSTNVLTSVIWNSNFSTYYSAMIPIDAKYVNRLWASRLGDRVALYTDTDVRVCNRCYFDDPEGGNTCLRFSKMVYRDKIPQIEHVAKFMRSRNWPTKGLTGESMYAGIIRYIAQEWQWAEQNTDQEIGKETLARLEAWKATGNEMALAASAKRHLNAGHDARGGDYADKVTDEGWAELARRVKLAQQDIDELLAMEKPPGIAFDLHINAGMLGSDSDIQDAFEKIKRCMSLYPEYLGVHSYINTWLLPRWGGQPGSCDAYCSKIASLYPESLQDTVYCLLILDAMSAVEHQALYSADETDADLDRMFRGAESLRDQNRLDRNQCEGLARIAQEVRDEPHAEEYLRYEMAHFPTPSSKAQSHQSRSQLLKHKYYQYGAAHKQEVESKTK